MENLTEYKCANCRKVLVIGVIVEGVVSKDCPKCGCRNIITVKKVFVSQVSISLVPKPVLR